MCDHYPPTAPPLATTKGQLELRETSQRFKMLTYASVLMKAAIWTRRCLLESSAGLKNYRRSEFRLRLAAPSPQNQLLRSQG